MKAIVIDVTGFVTVEEVKRLGDFQKIVQGHIQLVPHEDGWQAAYTAYVNESGVLMHLPPNHVATRVLKELRFYVNNDRPLAGNVLLLGKDEKGLTVKQRDMILNLVLKS